MQEFPLEPFAPVLLKMIQKPLYRDERLLWKTLQTYLEQLQEYIARIGLVVMVSESDGYAFLHQPELTDQAGQPLPRIMRQEGLNYYETLLCVVLREQLALFDVNDFESDTLLFTSQQLREFCEPFFPSTTNAVIHAKKMNAALSRLTELGFLKCIQEEGTEKYFEVQRIIKAKLTASFLAELKERIKRYVEKETESDETSNDETNDNTDVA